jgi:hypothetical protein
MTLWLIIGLLGSGFMSIALVAYSSKGTCERREMDEKISIAHIFLWIAN